MKISPRWPWISPPQSRLPRTLVWPRAQNSGTGGKPRLYPSQALGLSRINSMGLGFCFCNKAGCCAGLVGLKSCLGRVWPNPGHILKVTAAVMVMVSFLHTSAYSFIYSGSAVDPELDQTLKGLTEHRL